MPLGALNSKHSLISFGLTNKEKFELQPLGAFGLMNNVKFELQPLGAFGLTKKEKFTLVPLGLPGPFTYKGPNSASGSLWALTTLTIPTTPHSDWEGNNKLTLAVIVLHIIFHSRFPKIVTFKNTISVLPSIFISIVLPRYYQKNPNVYLLQ